VKFGIAHLAVVTALRHYRTIQGHNHTIDFSSVNQ